MTDLIFVIHLTSLAVAAIGILVADSVGFSWIRGKAARLSPATLHRLHDSISYALTGLILSGLYLFWPMRAYLLGQPLFLLKMGFIAVLVVNSLLIDRLMLVATKVPFAAVSTKGKALFFLSGALSAACWLGAGISALVVFGL